MDSKPKTTVLVADQSHPFREALRAVLEQQEDLELAGEAEHDRQLAAMLETRPIDILVLDAELPRAGALGALRTVYSLHSEPRVLLTGGPFSEGFLSEVLLQGVRGFLLRGCPPQDYVKAIGIIRAGDLWLGRKVLVQVFTGWHARAQTVDQSRSRSWAGLTPREREVAGGIAHGLSNKEIARQLEISAKTVKAHLSHVFAKLGVSRRIQVALPRPTTGSDLARAG